MMKPAHGAVTEKVTAPLQFSFPNRSWCFRGASALFPGEFLAITHCCQQFADPQPVLNVGACRFDEESIEIVTLKDTKQGESSMPFYKPYHLCGFLFVHWSAVQQKARPEKLNPWHCHWQWPRLFDPDYG
jgi:hypothetical protein